MLKVGDKAPEIRVHTDTGEDFRLSGMLGKRVVLYFYPKADTPGCTVEDCEFRDGIKAFAKKGAAVVGVSPDKPTAQAKFKQKYDLPFTLLADEDKTAAEAYGVWKEKNMYGKKVMGIRSEEHTSELQSHSDLHSFPTRRSSDLVRSPVYAAGG